jgi:hypothetical protein
LQTRHTTVSFQIFKEVYAGKTIDTLSQAFINKKIYIPLDKSYEIGIIAISTTHNRIKLSTRQRRKILNQFGLPRSNFASKKNGSDDSLTILRNKEYYILLLIYNSKQTITSVHFLKHVVNFENDFGKKYAMKKKPRDQSNEPSIKGTTPIKPPLAKIMCNLGNITKTSFVTDPFVGSGSLLKYCHGINNIGIDALELRMIMPLNSNNDNGKSSNKHHDTHDLCLGNVFHQYFRDGELFDCIICDPPYGRREKHVDIFGKDDKRHETNVDRALSQFHILSPLFKLASRTLCIDGKLVFGFFNYPGNEKCSWIADDLPKYENLRIEHICREQWKYSSGHILARDVVVVRRVCS